MSDFEDVTPDPEYLIKSIAEQGYSLESALADLMDNSISASADKIEILTIMDEYPFTLFLGDNGDGMNERELKASMHFPSSSPDKYRKNLDLGRFGLGLKTASFSQTRKFTVLSRKNKSNKFHGRTWDLNILKDKKWKLKVNTQDEIHELINLYEQQSLSHLNSFDNFKPNTIVVWFGLHKYEEYLEEKNRAIALKREISEVTVDHLSLVFHRFMERKDKPIKIRVNNRQLEPFNPFPTNEKDLRSIEFKQKSFGDDSIKLEGFILPSRCIDEVKNNNTRWTTKYRSLIDMEGIYIYRANRIILFGGWNGLIKKAPRLQLARLRVEIGNSVDHLLHLNVSKSQVIIPHDLKDAFESYINDLKEEAKKEFFNRNTQAFSSKKENKINLFTQKATNKGMILELNSDFPILHELNEELTLSAQLKLKIILKMVNTQLNKIKQTYVEQDFFSLEKENEISVDELMETIKSLKETGITSQLIRTDILPQLGYKKDSFPKEVVEVLNDK